MTTANWVFLLIGAAGVALLFLFGLLMAIVVLPELGVGHRWVLRALGFRAHPYCAQESVRPDAVRVYVAGPMTGLPDLNYPAFHKVSRDLRKLDFHVENPAENPAPPSGEWAEYMRMAVTQLASCDVIYMLPGWKDSRGACIEHDLARALGVDVQYENPMANPSELYIALRQYRQAKYAQRAAERHAELQRAKQ